MLPDQQQTIQQTISFAGIALHTAIPVKVTLLPMPLGSGIQFQRIDLPQQPIVEAVVAHLVATEQSTLLEKEGVRVGTIEHLLAAIAAMQIDNICIQLDGPELPDLDGSALAFVEHLLQAGILAQAAPRKFFQLKEPFVYKDPYSDSHFAVYPDSDCSFHVTIAYDRWPLAHQHAALDSLTHFKEEIAAARTFIYLDEIAALYQKGVIQGGDPTKAVIFSDQLNNQPLLEQIYQLSGKKITDVVTPLPDHFTLLRYANEPARHKLLDLIGDMALLGRPLQGKVWAHKPGHAANSRFVAALQKHLLKQERKAPPLCDLYAAPLFDVQQIAKMLPHRYPFQLVDKIMQLDDKAIIGIKNVTINEPFFRGHFPAVPIMPGVLQVEALAQVAGILALHRLPDLENYLTYFLSIDHCKFRRMVVPGDTLLLHCQFLTDIKFTTTPEQSAAIAKVKGQLFVGQNLVCEALLLAQIVKSHASS